MLEGELQTIPAMTPSPSSSSTSFKKPEEKQSDSVPSAKLTPHSGSLRIRFRCEEVVFASLTHF